MHPPGRLSPSGQFLVTTTHGLPCRNMGNSSYTLQRTTSRSGTPQRTLNLPSFHAAAQANQSRSLQTTGLQLFHGKRTSLSRLFLLSKYALRSSSVFPHLNTFPFLIHKEPDIRIGNAALEAWKGGQFKKAEKLLTAAIPRSIGTAHHVFASRALVQARLRQWDTALVDAEKVFSLYSHTYIR